MKKVLIAHQSTIPHYRLAFYNSIAKLKPQEWKFDVVFDIEESRKKRFFKEELDFSKLNFGILNTKTYYIKHKNTYWAYQNFLRRQSDYDLIIVEQALNNLAYPLAQGYRLFGKKVALWGHGRHMSAVSPSMSKRIMEWIKSKLLFFSDGFFGYTEETKSFLINKNYPSNKIFILNNTIDILNERKYYNKFIDNKAQLKSKMGIAGKKVLLFVGRFNHTKRLEFLIQSVSLLLEDDNDYCLLIVGSGNDAFVDEHSGHENIKFLGSVTDPEELSPLYCISDLFVFPGQVGLGPLQAMCFDLPVLTIDSPRHMPEYVYLSDKNSIILEASTTPIEYKEHIKELFESSALDELKSTIWPSINGYTVDRMALNMINGINNILK